MGVMIYDTGDYASECYFIHEGEAGYFVDDIRYRVLPLGALFGDIELLFNETRLHCAKATLN
jgi:hypothetical protein